MVRKNLITPNIRALLASSIFLIQVVEAAPPFAEGRVLVKPAAGLSEHKLEDILDRVGGRAREKLEGLDVHIVDVAPQAEEAVVRALSHNPAIAFAELDQSLEPVGTVNDPNFPQQWHLPKMQVPDAWQYADGSGIKVAVCDSGVYANHPDLAGQVLVGWNTVSNNTDSSDIYGHGTKVAGTIAAATNNLIGIASTAPGTKILPVRVAYSSDGRAYYSDIAECIRWAADNGARIANVSYLAAGSATVESAGSYMTSKGGIVTVSAGNYNTDHGYSNSPYLFVAAATDSGDNKASYSSYGSYVDIAAPGSGIYTTNSSGGYSSVSGTSFASPNTAAVAALIMAANPSLNATDVTAVLSNTAVDLGEAGWDPYFGHGRVDALAAVQLAANVKTSDTVAPNVSVSSPGANQTIGGQVAISIIASDDFGVSRVDLLIDGVKFASETQGQDGVYQFSWDSVSVADGKHRISARAVDAAGNIGASSDVYVTVSNVADNVSPTARIDSPADGATVSGNVTLSGFGQDDQAMAQFRLSVNGQLQCSGTSSASCGWNTRKLSNGSYTISAEAIDHAGNVGSTSISVIIGSTTSDSTGDGGSSKPGKGVGRSK